jgi:hypothetical protein
MYMIESLKCKACTKWLPPIRLNLLGRPTEFECPSCKQRRAYNRLDLQPRCVPGNKSDGPLYQAGMRWQRVSGCGSDFLTFASETDPVAPVVQSVAATLDH